MLGVQHRHHVVSPQASFEQVQALSLTQIPDMQSQMLPRKSVANISSQNQIPVADDQKLQNPEIVVVDDTHHQLKNRSSFAVTREKEEEEEDDEEDEDIVDDDDNDVEAQQEHHQQERQRLSQQYGESSPIPQSNKQTITFSNPHGTLGQHEEEDISSLQKGFRGTCMILLKSRIGYFILVVSTFLQVAAYLMHNYAYRATGQSRNSLTINLIAYIIEIISNIPFTAELFLLGIAKSDKTSSLKELLTLQPICLCLILISSWLSIAGIESTIIENIKHFRILTIFRLFPELEKKVSTFFGSFKHLGKTFFPLACVILFYAIIGISFFKGHVESRCRLTEFPEHGQWEVYEPIEHTCGYLECPEGLTCGNPADYDIPSNHEEYATEELLWGYSNFNDIPNALFSVYNHLMVIGWIQTTSIYWRAQDKTVSGIYFVSLVLLLSQIFSNIVLATLYEGFVDSSSIKNKNLPSEKSKKPQITLGSVGIQAETISTSSPQAIRTADIIFPKQKIHMKRIKNRRQTLDHFKPKEHYSSENNPVKKKQSMFQMILQSQISNVNNQHELEKYKNSEKFSAMTCVKVAQLLLKKFAKSSVFHCCSFFSIIGAAIVLACDNDLLTSTEYIRLNEADFVFSVLLFFEVFIELLSKGVTKYCADNLNILDFLIVVLHVFCFIAEPSLGYDIFNPTNQYFLFIRWTKILRCIKLFHNFSIFGNLKIYIQTYYQTLRSLPEFLIVFVVLILLFAQIGREIFGNLPLSTHAADEVEEESHLRINYDSLQDSLIAVTMIFFNEEWHITMYEYRRLVGYKSIVFHLICMLICQVLYIRLFIAIFISQFMVWLRKFEIEYKASQPYENTVGKLFHKVFNESFLSRAFLKGNDSNGKGKVNVLEKIKSGLSQEENLQQLTTEGQLLNTNSENEQNNNNNNNLNTLSDDKENPQEGIIAAGQSDKNTNNAPEQNLNKEKNNSLHKENLPTSAFLRKLNGWKSSRQSDSHKESSLELTRKPTTEYQFSSKKQKEKQYGSMREIGNVNGIVKKNKNKKNVQSMTHIKTQASRTGEQVQEPSEEVQKCQQVPTSQEESLHQLNLKKRLSSAATGSGLPKLHHITPAGQLFNDSPSGLLQIRTDRYGQIKESSEKQKMCSLTQRDHQQELQLFSASPATKQTDNKQMISAFKSQLSSAYSELADQGQLDEENCLRGEGAEQRREEQSKKEESKTENIQQIRKQQENQNLIASPPMNGGKKGLFQLLNQQAMLFNSMEEKDLLPYVQEEDANTTAIQHNNNPQNHHFYKQSSSFLQQSSSQQFFNHLQNSSDIMNHAGISGSIIQIPDKIQSQISSELLNPGQNTENPRYIFAQAFRKSQQQQQQHQQRQQLEVNEAGSNNASIKEFQVQRDNKNKNHDSELNHHHKPQQNQFNGSNTCKSNEENTKNNQKLTQFLQKNSGERHIDPIQDNKDKIKNTSNSSDNLDNNTHQQRQSSISSPHDLSFFIFPVNSKIRIISKTIVEHKYFDFFMVLSITTMAIILAIDSPFQDPESTEKKTLRIITLFLATVFLAEVLLQSISYGFIFSHTSFILKSPLNIVDFVTAIASLLYGINPWKRQIFIFKFILICRMPILLSFLSKPVKDIHFAGKIIMKCLPRMLRLIFFAVLFLFVTGVLATKLLKGSMNSCVFSEEKYTEELTVSNKWDCLDQGGDWVDSIYNFNNIFNSLSILFTVQSSEGWLGIMFSAYDSTSRDEHSQQRHNSLWAVFFIQFFFIANICILNMFVGLVVETHQEMIEHEHQTKELHKFQKEWLFIKKSIYQLAPITKDRIPQNIVRKFIYLTLVSGYPLKVLFYIFTIMNCLSFTIFSNRQSKTLQDNLVTVNGVCLAAMSLEVLLKILSMGGSYFKEFWNVYDFLPVSIGWVNYGLQTNYTMTTFSMGLRIFDGIAKGVQLLRFYRIMKHFTIVQKLFKSLQYAVSSIFGIFLVMIIFLYTSVLLCMNLFPFLKYQDTINGYDIHFKTFFSSLFALIRVMTSELWYSIPSEAAKQISPNFVCRNDIILFEDYQEYGQNACGTWFSFVFFYGFYMIFILVILNIFIATIIESYKEAFSADESAVNHYQLHDVVQLWQQYDPEGKGYISYKEFWQFSSQIAIIYGVESEELLDISNKNKFLKTLDIPIFEDPVNRIFCYKFHDVVRALSKISVQIKYGITNLEPEDETLRAEIEKLIIKSPLKGDSMIKPTPFTSADMVLIIVLTRKVKQWKNKLLNKEHNFVFDIRNLTHKLREQIKLTTQQSKVVHEGEEERKSEDKSIGQKGDQLLSGERYKADIKGNRGINGNDSLEKVGKVEDHIVCKDNDAMQRPLQVSSRKNSLNKSKAVSAHPSHRSVSEAKGDSKQESHRNTIQGEKLDKDKQFSEIDKEIVIGTEIEKKSLVNGEGKIADGLLAKASDKENEVNHQSILQDLEVDQEDFKEIIVAENVRDNQQQFDNDEQGSQQERKGEIHNLEDNEHKTEQKTKKDKVKRRLRKDKKQQQFQLTLPEVFRTNSDVIGQVGQDTVIPAVNVDIHGDEQQYQQHDDFDLLAINFNDGFIMAFDEQQQQQQQHTNNGEQQEDQDIELSNKSSCNGEGIINKQECEKSQTQDSKMQDLLLNHLNLMQQDSHPGVLKESQVESKDKIDGTAGAVLTNIEFYEENQKPKNEVITNDNNKEKHPQEHLVEDCNKQFSEGFSEQEIINYEDDEDQGDISSGYKHHFE